MIGCLLFAFFGAIAIIALCRFIAGPTWIDKHGNFRNRILDPINRAAERYCEHAENYAKEHYPDEVM